MATPTILRLSIFFFCHIPWEKKDQWGRFAPIAFLENHILGLMGFIMGNYTRMKNRDILVFMDTLYNSMKDTCNAKEYSIVFTPKAGAQSTEAIKLVSCNLDLITKDKYIK